MQWLLKELSAFKSTEKLYLFMQFLSNKFMFVDH